jgi:phosphoribosylamine--glycine ligase
MKVLVIGNGGREHALVWKIAQSPRVSKIYCAPGSAGIARLAECVDIPADNIDALAKFAEKNGIDLAVVGPEAPLAAGIVDHFKKFAIPVFGPDRRAAEIESSKSFAKDLMRVNSIPTAGYWTFDEFAQLERFLRTAKYPLVLKADGLAAGKGVSVCKTAEEANAIGHAMMTEKIFGEAGRRVVAEEFLIGLEASILALVSGDAVAILEPAQDHKAVFDRNEGPNTGGMGAYSPVPAVTENVLQRVERDIIIPTVHGMNREDRPYTGVLYVGIMLTANGPKVLEYNCRFGDPETQPLLMRLKSDLVDLIEASITGQLGLATLEWNDGPALCVVLASRGYPGKYDKGLPITGIEEAEAMDDVAVFHAGTTQSDGVWRTAGGRVLGVTARGTDIGAARARAYEAVKKINFEGMHYRTDIGLKAV